MSPERTDLAPDCRDLMAVEDAHRSGVYVKRPISIVKAEGAYMWDSDGNRYIDCIAGQGVANVGHNHPAVVEAVKRQIDKVMICNDAYYHGERALFLKELTERTPGDLNLVFLSNAGTEAVETAIKAARFLTGRTGIVAIRRGFHGRTMGSLSLTWNPKYQEQFLPLIPGITHVPMNDVEALQAAVTEATAAVVMELIQGEGGVFPADPDYIAAVRKICTENGTMMVADEIQTGMGRTGAMFASDHHGLLPDIMTLGKAMGGGMPLGATIWRESLGPMKPGAHGSTFGGNPMASAAGRAVLKVLDEEGLPQRADEMGRRMMEGLLSIDAPVIREIRGRGLMIGIDLRKRSGPFIRALMERKILVSPAGTTVLRLLPPLTISVEDIDKVVEAIDEVLHEPAAPASEED